MRESSGGGGVEKYAEHFAGQVESFELLLPLLHAHFVHLPLDENFVTRLPLLFPLPVAVPHSPTPSYP